MTALHFPHRLQRELTQTAQEQKELLEKLQEETEQKEQLRKLKNEMESERWHLDKTIEKLQKEVRGQEVEQGSSGPRGIQALSPGKARETHSSPKQMHLGVAEPLQPFFELVENSRCQETCLKR